MKIKVAATQMSCTWKIEDNISKAKDLIDKAAKKGANIILLQELFQSPYFCIEYDEKIFKIAQTFENNKILNEMSEIARKLNVVLPISFFEKENNAYFNSIAVIDANGTGSFLSGSGDFKMGDASNYIRYDNSNSRLEIQAESASLSGSQVDIQTDKLQVSASGIQISSTEKSMSLGSNKQLNLDGDGGTGGAPIINTLIFVTTNNTEPISTMFVVSLTVVILGAITTLVCAPKPGKPAHPPVDAEPVLDDEVIEENDSPETAADADNSASGEEESSDDTATPADDVTGSDIADDGVIEAGGEDADDSQDDASATSEPSEDDTDNSIQEDRVSDSLSDSGENDSDDDSEGEGLVAGDSEDNDESDEDVESTEDDTASDDD